MSHTDLVAAELPYLRRYARAIAGDQEKGDALVRSTLEAYLENPSVFDGNQPIRAQLYRLFHTGWTPKESPGSALANPLPKLSARARHALLLWSVEGFSLDEISVILAGNADQIGEEMEEAREIIADTLRSNVMIIEDEPVIALHIQQIVREMGHNVVGFARTHEEAVTLARSATPELVLADISLADGSSGIDAVRDILATMDVPVIFITAFPERLLTGERPEPTFLITKPFEPVMLTATIVQALLIHRERADRAGAKAAMAKR